MLSSSGDQDVGIATTPAACTADERDMAKCTTSQARTEVEKPCLLFFMASVVQLSLELGVDTALRSTAVGNTFWHPWIVATFSVPTRAVCYGDVTVKDQDE